VSASSLGAEVTVSKDKYLEILGFTIYAYLTGKITAYSGLTGGKRSLGEYIENFIYGKVAEAALQSFLMREFNLEALTDVDIADFVLGEYLPDIIAFRKDGDYEQAHFWVEVKEVRRDQKWLLIPASAVRSRPYDAYVAVWVGLPDEHIAWIIKYVPQVQSVMGSDWAERLAELEKIVTSIPCRVIGFAPWSHVKLVVEAEEKGDPKARQALDAAYGPRAWHYFSKGARLYDPENPSWKGSEVGENVGFFLSRLAEASDWRQFVELMLRNQRLADKVPLKRRGKAPGACEYISSDDLREFFDRCLGLQLNHIKRTYGTIKRSISWFQQPLR